MSKAAIQFFRGVNEPVVPDIRLTRSRDGRTGQATFRFEQPAAIAPETMGDITGMWMRRGIRHPMTPLQTGSVESRWRVGGGLAEGVFH